MSFCDYFCLLFQESVERRHRVLRATLRHLAPHDSVALRIFASDRVALAFASQETQRATAEMRRQKVRSQWRVFYFKTTLLHSRDELLATRREMKHAQHELDQTQKQLMLTRSELNALRMQHVQLRDELEETRSKAAAQLEWTRGELHELNAECMIDKQLLAETRKQLHALGSESACKIQHLGDELAALRDREKHKDAQHRNAFAALLSRLVCIHQVTDVSVGALERLNTPFSSSTASSALGVIAPVEPASKISSSRPRLSSSQLSLQASLDDASCDFVRVEPNERSLRSETSSAEKTEDAEHECTIKGWAQQPVFMEPYSERATKEWSQPHLPVARATTSASALPE